MAGKGFFGSDNNDEPLSTSTPKDDDSTEQANITDESSEVDANDIEDVSDDAGGKTKKKGKGFFSSIIEKIKEEKGKTNIEGGDAFRSFLKNISRSKTGKNAPPKSAEELEKASKNKIVAVIGIGLLLLFGAKTYFKDDPSAVKHQNSAAPDAGSTSLFDDYQPAIGVIKGQVVTTGDVENQVDKATKLLRSELKRMQDQNNQLRKHEIVVAQGAMDNNPTHQTQDTVQKPNNTSGSNQGTIQPPELPPIIGRHETFSSPAPNTGIASVASADGMDTSYPMVGQESSIPQPHSDFGVSGDKVYSYSPVTDAVQGVAGAVKDSVTGGSTNSGGGGVNSADPVAIIPASTIVGGVMLSGLDAPTGSNSASNPMPIVMQLLDDGTTASFFKVPIKGCRIILAGYGDLPSERVYMRLERLVCIAETGEVYSAAANGNVLGEDGKNGMRGRVVDKQGALILRSMLAGMMQGVGDVFKTLQQTTLASATTGLVTQNSLSGTQLGKAAVGSGLSASSEKLAAFYLKKAEQLFPIIEISAGRDVEVLFTRDLQFFPISKIVGSGGVGETDSGKGYWDIPVSGG